MSSADELCSGCIYEGSAIALCACALQQGLNSHGMARISDRDVGAQPRRSTLKQELRPAPRR